MVEPITISVAGLLVAEFLGHSIGSHIIGSEAHHQYRHFVEKLNRRLLIGGLPHNEHLLGALHRSLAGSALVFGYTLHDPDRILIRELLKSKATWKNFSELCHQIRETFRRNIIPENMWRGDPWLSKFIEVASVSKNFQDFDLKLVLTDNRMTALVSSQLNEELRDHIVAEFLRWTEQHVRTLARKPLAFDSSIRDGLTLGRERTVRLNFYEIFCLFFREELKEDTSVHRAYVIDVLAELKNDVDEIVKAVPTAEERTKLLQAVESLSNFKEFKEELERKNSKELERISAALASIGRKLDYAIAGLPIQRFEMPDPPTHELELLHAKHRAVDLVGRDTDLDSLWKWLTTGERISARLLVGRAGVGKTRIAYELLVRVYDELPEWQAGLITGTVLRKFDATKQAADWTWAAPTLLVIDYAQTVASPLADLFLALTHKRHIDDLPPLRILLLERQDGEWFDALLREEDSGGPCAVRVLFNPSTPVALTPLPEGQLRRKLLAQVLARAEKLNNRKAITPPPEGQHDYESSLQRELFAEPLNLMLAGLAAAQLGLLPALTRSRTELAEELAKKELRRLARFVHTPGNEAEKQAIWHVAACATIQRGLTLKELDATVEEELAALKTVWRDGPGDLASVFRRVLPDVTLVVAPIEPDFVGEALVLMVLARPLNQGPERWSDWSRVVERCCRRKPQATATFLLHALQNFGGDAKYSESLLTGMDVLISAGIAEAEPRLLTAIEAAMIPMREDASLSEFERTEVESRAVNVTAHLYARLKAAWRHGREELRPEVARIASNLSVRLSDLDRDVEALDPASEAVELYRPLAKEDWRFRVNLADALSNLAITLGHLGRKEEGVRLAEEAVESYRMLLSQKSLFPVGLLTPPPPFVVAGLSRTLNNLANSLCGLEKWAEALALAQESVALCRILVRLNENYESELANRLGTVTRVMAGMGRQADVAEAAAEAIRLLHPRFKRRPEAWDPVLRVLIRIYVEATTATHIQSDEAMSLVISEISEMLNGLDVEEHKPRYK